MFDERLFSRMVAINSVYPNEDKLGGLIAEFLLSRGFRVEKQYVSSNRFNMFATFGQGKQAVLFYGHLDTVPFSIKGWKSGPFKLTKLDDRSYGLGSYDMKGGIAAFISAVVSSRVYSKLLLTVDEENISEGAWKAVDKKKFFQDVNLIISAEPNFGNGINSITVGRVGRVIFEIEFVGKSAHIANYEEGIDAIELMSRFIAKLYTERDKLFKSKDTVIQARKTSAESIGMSVCGLAKLELEVMVGVEDDVKEVGEKLQRISNFKVKLKSRKTPYLKSYMFSKFPYKDLIGRIITEHTGNKMKLIKRTSVSDDNVLATLGTPVITWGPDGGNAHSANEYVNISSINKLTQMFSEFLKYKSVGNLPK